MIYGYARVSTKGQAANGNSLEDQEQKLREAGAEIIFTDSFTGTKMDRPEFNKLKTAIKPGDTLIVTKLDRIARTASRGSELVQEFIANDVKVHVLNMGLIDNTPTGRLMVTMLLAFAEFERDMIVERTQEGKKIAKMSPDYREGRPKLVIDDELFKKLIKEQQEGNVTVLECCRQLSISKKSWYNKVKEVM